MKKLITVALAALAAVSCTNDSQNPLLSEWDTPFGIPPFEKIKTEHFKPAIEEAIKQHNAEIDAIVNNPEEPTFENTLLALDNAGELLSRVQAVFSGRQSIASDDAIQALAKEISPITSAHSNEVSLNPELFKRVKALYEKKDSLGLEPDQMRLLEETYKDFVRGGADLPEESKERLKEINTKISDLHLQFSQNLLQQTAAWTLTIEDEKDLAGLSEDFIADAASRAEKKGLSGKWIVGLDNPSVMPFLSSADNRELRTEVLDAYLNRCNHNDEYDNKEIIKQIVALKLEKAKLFGFDNYAAYALDARMAKTPEAVYELLDQIWTPALNAAKAELADIAVEAAKDGITDVTAADWRYYFEKAKASRYNISEEETRPYFKLENVREGIFYTAGKLFGITFEELTNVPLPHPEAKAFECKDADGTSLGVVFFDMFARPGQKRGGAWCGGYRGQKYENGERVGGIVTIVGNFSRPTEGKPALLTIDEVETYFHEFGHGLASLLRDVHYKGLGGYVRDFVELPSQINEHWAFEPEVLQVYAKHYQTGEVIPMELVEKLDKAGKYGQGFATTEYLAASLLDMDYHVLNEIPADLDVEKFEAKVLGDRGLLSQIPPRYRSTYFQHTFTGGYTAGYYSYIWAEVLDCDAFCAFKEAGDIFDQTVAKAYRTEILERANEDDAMNLFINFRGRKPGIDALLDNRGLSK